ncbi:MAG: acyltransferase domain-containing protein, partial [Rhodospirillales bacterium]|nr:acyltransferase domain-containing protein [Rhodospirillales bacterium]
VSMGGALYAREPVVRAVLDRCDAVLGDERGASLLDAMFGGAGAEGGLSDPAWARPATYALACALTALWASVGIRPSVVAGQGAGEIAAAQAAGVFGPEDGLRLAAPVGDAEAALEGIGIAAPSLIFVSGLTGRVVDSDQVLDGAYWRRQAAGEPASLSGCAETLAALGVDVVIEIGCDAVLAPLLAEAWPKAADNEAAPTLLSSLRQPPVGEEEGTGHADSSFVEAVARAYEAGLGVSFAGLFAGETRRRISLPGYPFQRRRFWLPKSGRQSAAAD